MKFKPTQTSGSTMSTHRMFPPPSSRHGLSIMEVLFAIGVLTVGLLGIASILPVATGNAKRTLDLDRAVEEVNNRVSADLARISGKVEGLIVANNSVTGFNTSRQRYVTVPYAEAPDAFCIDPWFLFAGDNLRNDTGSMPDTQINGYDRTLFPCYDSGYQPILASPSAPMSFSRPMGWNGPRMPRVALPFDGAGSIASFASAASSARSADNLAVIAATDNTKAPGLFVKATNGNTSLSRATVSGKYSSMVMMSRSAPGSDMFNASVVTLRDRELLINPSSMPISYSPTRQVFANLGTNPGNHPAFNLTPFTAAAPDAINPAPNELVYPNETVGYVTYTPGPIRGGGGGEFTYRHSAFANPQIGTGDWVLLMRREYSVAPGAIPPGGVGGPPATKPYPQPAAVPGPLKFAWYRVTNVTQQPTLDDTTNPTFYETSITVRGADWLFHPAQIYDPVLNYLPPYPNGPAHGGFYPADLNPDVPAYDFSVVGHPDFGTTIVLMPNVIGVQTFQVRL
ncbi:type IV pilus modification PilV family protein [Stieleria varia]|uniref:Uncharacterized protein n=1 Tax=Stieleria varia TaxID=2528005 RepID=A0A5C6B6R3_9BACT|nr:hypothetical protein [Stieleria varia]TWU07648.1 hypothetical protein Pla52n_02210 [Stieleria varia]